MSDKKQSQFIEVDTLIDSDYVPVFGAGTNRKISKANLFEQIKDETQIFIYPTIEQLQAADLVADPDWPIYVRVEETGYKLYKITSVAAADGDIALDNGTTATLQSESILDRNIASFADLATTPARLNQIVNIQGHTIAGVGGGQFIAIAGSVTNDSGTQINSATTGIYWKRINYAYLWVEDFGAIGDGPTDDTTAIQNAVNYLGGIGGGQVLLRPVNYKITNTILINYSNVKLIGSGGDIFHDGGTSVPSTTLNWYGSAGGSMILLRTDKNAALSIRNGLGVSSMRLNGRAIAGKGIDLISIKRSVFEDLFVYDVTISGYNLSCWVGGSLAEASDSRELVFRRCFWRMKDSAAVQNACGFIITSETPPVSGANVCFSIFESCNGQTYNGQGWLLADSDNNSFHKCTADVFNIAAFPSFDLVGGDANNFYNCSVPSNANAIHVRNNQVRNSFYAMDGLNGTQYPTLDAGCRILWIPDSGAATKFRAGQMVLAQNEAIANTEFTNLGTESLRIRNGASNHIILTDGGSNQSGINIDSATGDLRFLITGGTGSINLGNGAIVKIGGMKITYGTAAPTTGTWSRGDKCWQTQPAVGSPKGWQCTASGTPGTWVSEGNL